MKRFLIMFFSLIMALMFTFPNLALAFMFFFVYFSKYVSAVFCLIFAYNSARFVESIYVKSIHKRTDNASEEFHYKIDDEKLHFTFIVRDDGRQLDRLKFMRKQFFKDK